MLLELRVENFAIIEKLTIPFEQGLTVFTGETGAGKSIIIDAIGLLVGGRGSAEYVRHGAKKAEIEALFDIQSNHLVAQILCDLGIEHEDDMLILRRQIYDSGKSICRINGKLVTLTNLREVGQRLIDIHGQHEHQELMHTDKHMALLDRFGGQALLKLKKDFRTAYGQANDIYTKMKRFSQNEQQIAQRIDLLKYQIKEIKDADLEPGEEASLLEERRRLNNYEKIYQALHISYEALNGESNGLDYIRQAVNQLESVQDLDQDLQKLSEAISGSFYILEENAFGLREQLEQLEFNPERLNDIESRLNDISKLKRKYGQTISEILDYLSGIEMEYAELSDRDQKIDDLEKSLKAVVFTLKEKGEALSVKRYAVAENLQREINAELKDLYMEKSVYKVHIQSSQKLESFQSFKPDGIDTAQFMISTNPGEPLKPLAKIASGGEMSRIMLAIKSNFKSLIGLTSIIFDEVDTGVSGRVAQAMAEKIHQLSDASQVFCITHLPQVAAMADQHLYISKRIKNKRTQTNVQALNNEEQAKEIGRMISGAEMTDLTKKHAKELLHLAKEIKASL
ncbi:DNA replication and repair protein RecN [Scopulibacillus darangshiensis]|uniref:DNA repair protein RecN n=1 Tax=Scopulibacillus darangshiensis TaxID=442528 RepID=A0A4R2P8D9_9BACL|nr:DNA repair protein RecN [Scopulibacillus darangshiensis]TCP31192.1 DNA replication and repair protein RecN [Scopulibacillus darangshiensis]